MKQKQQKNFFLTGSDGGMVYTVAVMASLIISVAYSILVTFVNLGEKVGIYLGYFASTLSLALVFFYTLKNRNLHFKQSIAFKKFDKKYLLIALLLSVGALFSLSWINDAFIAIMEKAFGYKGSEIILPKENAFDFVLCVILICIFPAFFEESIFRGLILNGCKRLGDIFAIVTIGILFSLYHKNPMQTAYQFILGAVYALLVIKSGSIIPAMLMHFINNFYIIVLYFLTSADYVFPPNVNLILTAVGTVCLVGGLAWLIMGCKKPDFDQNLNDEYAKAIDIKDERKQFFYFSAIGIIVVLVLWIANLVTFIG